MLLLFTAEDDNGYTIEQLSSMTGINNTQFLTKIVNSITNDKYAILRYDGNRYYYNSSFKDKSTRIKLPMIKIVKIRTTTTTTTGKTSQRYE